MLAKSVERRPATPAEVGDALYPFTDGSDLSRLLAAAEGQPAAPVGTMVPRFRVAGRLARFACWVAAAAAILLLLTARGRWVRAKRQERENRAAVHVEHDGRPAPSPPPAVPSDWIVLSWTRLRLGKPNLWLFRPDGSQRINITNDPRYFDIHPRFSPDGRQIAFVRGESLAESNGVYVCNVDGSELRPRGNGQRQFRTICLASLAFAIAHLLHPRPTAGSDARHRGVASGTRTAPLRRRSSVSRRRWAKEAD